MTLPSFMDQRTERMVMGRFRTLITPNEGLRPHGCGSAYRTPCVVDRYSSDPTLRVHGTDHPHAYRPNDVAVDPSHTSMLASVDS